MAEAAAGVHVVVARFQENVSWVRELGYPATIYDKSGDPETAASDALVPLPNIGRETHTYLTHIVRNYSGLAEINAFLQGDPFFHLREDGEAEVRDLRLLIESASTSATPFQGLAWFRLKCDGLGRPHDMADPAKQGKWKGWGKDIPVADVFRAIFAAEPPQGYLCRGVTGNFVVTKDRIHARPRTFYEHCLSVVEDDPYDELNTGHAFERLWHLIFNGNTAWNRPAGVSR